MSRPKPDTNNPNMISLEDPEVKYVYKVDGKEETLSFDFKLLRSEGSELYVLGVETIKTSNSEYWDIDAVRRYWDAYEKEVDPDGTKEAKRQEEIANRGKKPSNGTGTIESSKGEMIHVAENATDDYSGKGGTKVLYFVNYARLFLNYKGTDENMPMAVAYLIIYIALIVFTAVFTIRYIKRVIYVAFLTLMAPMVALTYPLDKIKDRKSTGLEYVV